MPHPASIPTGAILGTRIALTSYDEALRTVTDFAAEGAVRCVAAANTQLIAEAALNPDYAAALRSFDLILPDGMPLVWALRLDGHEIEDRVYGPYFMEHALRHSPDGLRHYFFGSSEQCLTDLQRRAGELNPKIQIAGAASPPFGTWSEDVEARLIADINDARPDLVWVALGGVKQEAWIARNRPRLPRGVFLAVGDAFPLIAGHRAFAPAWMQQRGLTWLYRLCQEPGRMLPRYLSYNTRFVTAFLAALNDQAAAEKAWNKIFWIEAPTIEQAERRGREAAEKAIRVALAKKEMGIKA